MFAARTIALSALAFAACVPSIKVGDNPQGDDDMTTTAPDLTTGDDAPQTGTDTGEPPPGVCGDGVVDDGESCDDGNDAPDDGCDAACKPTANVVWSADFSGELTGFAVGPDGTFFACGWTDAAFLTAFAPDGTQLWSTQVPYAGKLAAGDAGQVFHFTFGDLRAFGPDGAPLWSSLADTPNDVEASSEIGVVATSDAIYASNGESGTDIQRLVVRRHDVATGEVQWEARTPMDRQAVGLSLAVAGDRVFVVGDLHGEPAYRPLLAMFETSGELVSLEHDALGTRHWNTIAPAGDGGLLLAGISIDDPSFAVRRLDAALAEAWTVITPEAPGKAAADIAVGPGGQIVVVGDDQKHQFASYIRMYDGAGALSWSTQFSPPAGMERDGALHAGFGPGALMLAGSSWSEDNGEVVQRWWIRRLALD